MTNKMKRACAAATAAITVFSTSLAGAAVLETETAEKTMSQSDAAVLNVGITMEPTSYDPAEANLVANCYTTYDCYDRLLTFSQDGTEVEPSLAESWEQVDDTTYTYKIREGVKFSDGNDLTMEDVLYSMNRVMDPNENYSMSYLFSNVESFEADDASMTLTVHLTQPDSTWEYVPATSPCTIVEKAVCEAEGDNYGTSPETTVGTGPYKLKSWDKNSQITLEKNENWWGDPSERTFDEINVYIMQDSSAVAMAAKNGSVDFIPSVLNEDLTVLNSLPNFALSQCSGTSTNFIALNTQIAPFDDENARKAVAWAIDCNAIKQAIGGELATDLNVTCLPEAMYYQNPEKWAAAVAELEDYTGQDYDKAKEYLAKSAYPDGFEFDYYTLHSAVTQAEVIQAMLEPAGITMNIKEILPADGYAYMYGYNADEEGHRPYQAFGIGWISDYLDPVGILKTQFHSDNTAQGCANMAMWSNSEFDELINKTYLTTDQDERTDLMIEAAKIEADACAYIPLYTAVDTWAVNTAYTYEASPQSFWNFSYTQVKAAG